MSHSCVQNYLYVILAAKGRLSLIPLALESRLYAHLCGISKKKQVSILGIKGTENHTHLLCQLHQSVALSLLIRELKSYSTGWLKKQGLNGFSWLEGYGVFSCPLSLVDSVNTYIKTRKKSQSWKL